MGSYLFVLGVIGVLLVFRTFFALSPHDFSLHYFRNQYARFSPANSTLGVGSILVVSGAKSHRREGLIQAANVTELDFTIPQQPEWTEEDAEKFKEGGVGMGRGTAFAWMSHHFAIDWWLKNTNESTALFLEDDVDWDIRLRTTQVPRAAAAIRDFFPGGNYWGNTTQWDVLWIGHCGDYWRTLDDGFGVGHHVPEDLEKVSHMLYEDDSIPPRYNQHPFTASLLTSFNVTENTRIIHQSQRPLCTFGYIVTREAAERITKEIAPMKAIEMAFDVAMLRACQTDKMRCWSINPELFHQMEIESYIAQTNEGGERIPSVEESAGLAQVMLRNESSNIDCGFFSQHFRWDDDEELEYLRQEVGRKGQCLKPGRELKH